MIHHPGVTSAIIGPHTMEQLESQLPAADLVLDAAVLDRIDGIVPPGTTVSTADVGWQNRAQAGGQAAALADGPTRVGMAP